MRTEIEGIQIISRPGIKEIGQNIKRISLKKGMWNKIKEKRTSIIGIRTKIKRKK